MSDIIPSSPAHPWAVSADEVVVALGVDPAAGLTPAEASRRLAEVGPNELEERNRPSVVRLFLAQLTNTMTVLLGAAAVITLVIGDRVDTVAIIVILVLNAAVGFVQEHRAEQAMAALRGMTGNSATVVRSATVDQIPSSALVPGDVVRLEPGDIVPADLRLVEAHALRVNEAALTGESEPTTKATGPLAHVGPSLVVEQHNMAFKGTAVTYGRGTGVVVATGMRTQMGAIATLMQAHREDGTPLQRRLAALGRRLAVAALMIVALLFALGVLRGEPADEMLLTAVSLAVAAIPEGLPAVVTVSLALGARRMASRQALVRTLPAVETLGSVTVICTDKTGTLTENRMVVEHVWTPGAVYEVSGSGYAPVGELRPGPRADLDEHLARLAMVAAGCNDATLHPPVAPGAGWTITGDPTEGALLALAGKLGVDHDELGAAHPRRAEIAFESDRRRMTTVHDDGEGAWVAAKGALSSLSPLLHPDDQETLERARLAQEGFASDGYRTLALAERRVAIRPRDLHHPEAALRLVGLVAISDPPRPGARAAITACRTAGVLPVMITGDSASTALAMGRRLGLDGVAHVLTGVELDELDDTTLAARVTDVRIYARTNPAQKLRIVDAWKANGAIVAMTGDGVNDAPALARADIGISMGITGTDVSREAADMVLADDDFASIVHAVEEGRRIYDNIRRFVRYLLTTNTGELLVMFAAPLLGLPLPLLPVQILWVNLVTDGFPAIALGLEPAEPDTMRRPPRAPTESILGRGLWQHAAWVGALMAAVVLLLLGGAKAAGWPWQTMTFTTIALLQLGHALAVRSERESVFRIGWRRNPWLLGAIGVSLVAQLATVYVAPLRDVFDTTALSAIQLGVVAVASTAALVAVEIEKWLLRRATSPRRT